MPFLTQREQSLVDSACVIHAYCILGLFMTSLQIRDIPEDLLESLKLRAEKDHRSIAQQAIVLLSYALQTESQNTKPRIKAIQDIRSRKIKTKSTEIDIVDLIREDRRR